MQACQNQVFGGRLGVVMDVAIGTRSCMCAHAHAPVHIPAGTTSKQNTKWESRQHHPSSPPKSDRIGPRYLGR